jgi:hypothetical protein
MEWFLKKFGYLAILSMQYLTGLIRFTLQIKLCGTGSIGTWHRYTELTM